MQTFITYTYLFLVSPKMCYVSTLFSLKMYNTILRYILITSSQLIFQTDHNGVEKNKQERMDPTFYEPVKVDIIWGIVLFFVVGHLSAIYGLYLVFVSAKIYTILFGKLLIITHILYSFDTKFPTLKI